MASLIRMRLTGFVRTGRALAPLIAALVVLATMYGGGAAQAGEAYGFSGAVVPDTVQALCWAGVALAGYGWLRRTRA
jgi:hypothetical protein